MHPAEGARQRGPTRGWRHRIVNDYVILFEPERALQDARAMFQRYLTGWAMDALHLRKLGLDTPCWREAVDEDDTPESLYRDAA